MAAIKTRSIFRRTINGKKLPFYYCRFIYSDGTEKTFTTKRTSKTAAKDYVEKLLKDEVAKEECLSIEQEKIRLHEQWKELELERTRLESLRSRIDVELKIPYLSEYVEFFTYAGVWYDGKNSRGVNISKRHCLDREATFNNHLLPFFGQYRLSEIKSPLITKFRIHLFKNNLSGNTINKCLSALREILKDAEIKGIINSVPIIERSSDKSKDKGILTPDEMVSLFPEDWEQVWLRKIQKTSKGFNKKDISFRETEKIVYVANLLASYTGCRLGEIQAVTIGQIDFKNKNITIDSAYDNRCRVRNDKTKTGVKRILPLPQKVIDALLNLIGNRNNPDEYIFTLDGKKPLEPHTITRGFYKALQRIGIPEIERELRSISFHQYRYYYNSELLHAHIPKELVQKMTGHLTDEMTEKYLKAGDTSNIREILENRGKVKLRVLKQA